MNKKLRNFLIIGITTIILTACTQADSSQSDDENSTTNQDFQTTETSNSNTTTATDFVDAVENSTIELSEDMLIEIDSSGTYTISGSSSEAQIIVDLDEDEKIKLVLDGVNMASSTGAPIQVVSADELKIQLIQGTENYITDNRSSKDLDEDSANAAIYSKNDLEISGAANATLTINGNSNDGINTKDDLQIKDLDLTIIAVDEGIRAKDSIDITDSSIDISAEGDGLKSDNTEEEKGIITLENSNISISAGDDGVHAYNLIEILSGNIEVLKSYEALESMVINIYDGQIDLFSNDDAINLVEKSDTDSDTGMFGMGGRGGGMAVQEPAMLTIYGGTLRLNSNGDGLDSNGNMLIFGGDIIVDGPSSNGNGALDVNGSLNVNGGRLLAIGSSGMAEVPDETSEQNSLSFNLSDTYSANTNIVIKDAASNILIEHDSAKSFQSVIFSSDEILIGESYTLELDGEEIAAIDVTDVISISGEAQTMGGGFGGASGGIPGDRPDFKGDIDFSP